MMYRGIVLRHQKTRTRLMLEELGRAMVLVILGGILAWMIFCAPEASGAESPHIVLNGQGNAGVAKICFEDVTERPGPPSVPVCFGADQWDVVAAPDYPEMAVTIYLDIDQPCVVTNFGRAGLGLAVFALRVSAGGGE
jgi:hypothetical protein